MSQFVLCRGDLAFVNQIKELKFVRLSPYNKFLWRASHHLFEHDKINQIWFVQTFDGHEFDKIFTIAQKEYLAGRPFENTLLGRFIIQTMEEVEEIVTWYASDWQELTCTYDKETFLLFLKESLNEPMCEAYLKYVNLKLGKVGLAKRNPTLR